jgi:hypothetical protein
VTVAVIWRCPNCRKGARAPQRLAKDDVRRWCLECSRRTGRLVERETAGAQRRAEAGRARAARTRRRNADAKRRERLASETVISSAGRIEVVRQTEKWAERLSALVTPGGQRAHPSITLRHRSDPACTGRASMWRVVLSIGPNMKPASIYHLVLHELAHTVADDHHGRQWRKTYVRAVRAAFPGIELSGSLKGASWTLDGRIVEAIDAHLERGGRIRWHVPAKDEEE